ncbi:LacI family DNA-binding transcriptional regulator [Mongoliibacter ruber]|uniref:LacI family transcriptional regulator n=1 Tax=Mongoliibacter ruber TaxID=1750599 RepID=A0A2T0WUL1_9BACT|nr:LacI family DNA-binding transcriptional regulator [Mongoliibacter ruber]PRY90396.1 LacI family transcriptional regulator [Mongoliibacter ruber]
MDKEVTIYDIAKDLGVSPTTVSRALNNNPAVNVKTKNKIYQAALAMGYQTNVFASNLRSKRTNNIGVIVPRLNSSFQSSVIAGMEKIANVAGFNLIISQSLESKDKEIANALTMFNSRVDGLIVSLASNTESLDHYAPFFKKNIPIIFYDRIGDFEEVFGVTIDNMKAAYEATSHLIRQGCQRIVHVLGSLKVNVYNERLSGYQKAFSDHGLPYEDNLIFHSDLNEEAGYEIVQKIKDIKPKVDGLFVSNDACAASCIKHLKLEGYKIPKDIAVVGFNNDVISRLVEPNITTINYPGYEMGEIAMNNLVNHLNRKSDSVLERKNRITLPSELIIRESSKKN